ncbi:Nitrogen assimilation transcription factor nit-4 [Colletotrichum sidae]|uniref:Nitrogen assimilation transcription factor nit-4 n=1 Tax=Colletotrichum sidae TaxID=1347389 RepID=A0A4R8TSC4_9PEZI|nr:Nitrogen assimilation transcription factor nit-4 [Colletotrichum sidae]
MSRDGPFRPIPSKDQLDRPGPRPLLAPPTPPTTGSSSNTSSADLVPQRGGRQRKKRRSYVTRACDWCKQKKLACDGEKTCFECRRRRIDCAYTAVSESILKAIPPGFRLVNTSSADGDEEAMNLLVLFREVSDKDALEALDELKTGRRISDVNAALRTKPGGSPGLSQNALNRAMMPPTRSSLEFELMMRHPIAYPTWAPVETSKLDLDYILLPSKVEWARMPITAPGKVMPGLTPRVPPFGADPSVRASTALESPKPVVAPSVYDERLLQIDIGKWTSIPVTNEFAMTVLSLYLETDHPLTPLFDPDLFLDGLIGRSRFCSKLLVSAVLGWSCQLYASFEPDATVVGCAFYEEAKRLRKTREGHGAEAICAVAALQYMAITAVSLGAGPEYLECLAEMLALAETLRLFNVAPTEGPTMDPEDQDLQQASAQVAWALFNSLTLLSMHIHKRMIEHPPPMAIPDLFIAPTTGGKPTKKAKRRQYLNDFLKVNCKFFLIVHDMLQLMYGPQQKAYAEAISAAFAEDTYRRLLDWADNLPLEFAQGNRCSHHAMVLHICYHLTVVDLFRPLIRHNTGTTRLRLPSFKTKDAGPEAVYSASVHQLKRIVLFYRQTHPESSFSLFWHSALLYLANAMLREAAGGPQNPEWRFYFRLCIASYQTLCGGYRLAKGIAQGLLSMALDRGAMDPREAGAVRRDLERRGRHHHHHDVSDQVVPESLVVDLDLAVTDPSAAQAEKLIRKLKELQVQGVDEGQAAQA